MSRQNSYRRTVNKAFFSELGYSRTYWQDFDYSILSHIMQRRQRGRGNSKRYNDVIIMADTETSKDHPGEVCINHVCLWTISLRAYHQNIVTLYGTKPSDMVSCMDLIHRMMDGDRTLIFFHNMSYDYVFLRKFMFDKWGFPTSQLNTKPHYPVSIEFDNGIIFRDSLIIAQRSLEKWGNDLNADHRKAVGLWDYDIIRNQDYQYSDNELTYAENDTLVGVECLDLFMGVLGCDLTTIPYTATGIVRKETRQIGGKNAHKQYLRKCITSYELLEMAFRIYHGGYTHGNRYLIGELITGLIEAYDFASSYPFVMIARKYPAEAFMKCDQIYSPEDILELYANDYAAFFTLKLAYPKLKDGRHPMPLLQMSKAKEIINPIVDNGRILQCDYIEIDTNEVDFNLLYQLYTWDYIEISNVYIAKKDWLPRWFTDFIFQKYKDKCELKGKDPVLYDISKTRVNCLYGMTAQRPIREEIQEVFETGEYIFENPEGDMQALLDKHNKKFGSILPYQWGIYVTSYAQENLFMLGSCCKKWIYSDTDSVYGQKWDKVKLNAYNEECKQIMRDRGYGHVKVGDKEYNLGVAECDGRYIEMKVLGSKRYCCRKESGELKLTVAGVPKKGVACLNDDINNFKEGMVFEGTKTNKKTHTFFYSDSIFTDKQGNEIGDCIDLSPCDYTLDMTERFQWLFNGYVGEFDVDLFDGGRIT